MTYRPWGKIIVILIMTAAIMGVFVWKYMDTMAAAEAVKGQTVSVPALLQPLYDLFGEKLFLVIGGVTSGLFAIASLKAVLGKPKIED